MASSNLILVKQSDGLRQEHVDIIPYSSRAEDDRPAGGRQEPAEIEDNTASKHGSTSKQILSKSSASGNKASHYLTSETKISKYNRPFQTTT